jgi:hypothetical protein
MTVPSVGQVVHYVAPDGTCTAAIVSAWRDGGEDVALTTFPVTGPNIAVAVTYGDPEARIVGTWHWPERV